MYLHVTVTFNVCQKLWLNCSYVLCTGNVYAMRVNLSVAIVAMTRNYTVVVNGTEVQVSLLPTWASHRGASRVG